MEAKRDRCPFTQLRKVDQATIDAILLDISKGAPKKHAAEGNGISSRHLYYMIAQGLVDLEYNKDTIHSNLVRSLRRIEMEEMQWCRENARESRDGHKGAQWTLEHAYWRYFGKDANAKELAEEIERLRSEMKGIKNETDSKETQSDTQD